MSPIVTRVSSGQGFISLSGYRRSFLSRSGGGGYAIERSLRFNSADSAYLNRTAASAGNRKTWTWAGWVKQTKLNTTNRFIFTAGTGTSDTDWLGMRFGGAGNNDGLVIGGYVTNWRVSASVFRDPSAWYHVVVAFDSTQATTANQIKAWVNNVEVTWSTSSALIQNTDYGVNQAAAHYIGYSHHGGYFDGYLADVHFIDGQALDPTSFGEFDANGIWQPIAYSGSYGTNGFHLDFADNSTAAALGTDASGNGNDWTVNNISVAAGADNDSLVDVPTNGTQTDTGVGGEVRGNYCTWNPLSPYGAASYSNGNLDISTNGTDGIYGYTLSTIGPTSGKWYVEFFFSSGGTCCQFGISSNPPTSSTLYIGQRSNDWGFTQHIGGYYSAGSFSYGNTWSAGDLLSIALDKDSNRLYFAINGVWQNSANPAAGTGGVDISSAAGLPAFFAAGDLNCGDITGSINFGQRPFAYTAPSGFKALCTTNLPAPVVAKPSEYMDVALYTGNGSTQTISGLGFSPDLVWIKCRSTAYGHSLFDIVRGTALRLSSDSTGGESAFGTPPAGGYVNSFNSDGFTCVGGSTNNTYVNQLNDTYAAWTWDAGSSTVTNNAGSITSSVRANPNAGFSIVTFTGSTSSYTVGHGLGVAPVFYIIKARNGVRDWPVYTTAVDGSLDYLYLNKTDTKGDAGNPAPTSTLVYPDQLETLDFVMYCFAPVAGYSAFGSYTGNGNADGPFVYTGFRPRWIMIKKSTTTGSWAIIDAARGQYNITTGGLFAESANAEDTRGFLDILSNGFKITSTLGDVNQFGQTHVYAAFAEHPFALNARAR